MRGWKLFLLVLLAPVIYIILLAMKEQIVDDLRDDRPADAKYMVKAALPTAIDQFRMANKRLPKELAELWTPKEHDEVPYIKPATEDPWGNPYKFIALSRKDYEIRSDGPDRKPGTDDDIVYTTVPLR